MYLFFAGAQAFQVRVMKEEPPVPGQRASTSPAPVPGQSEEAPAQAAMAPKEESPAPASKVPKAEAPQLQAWAQQARQAGYSPQQAQILAQLMAMKKQQQEATAQMAMKNQQLICLS